MTKPTKKEVFNIPNMMCYFRLLLIPLFSYLFLTAKEPKDYLWAGAVVLLSSLTDLFDGMIARKFNMVTTLGKVLDPVADKITHAALAICLAIKYPLMWVLIAIMAVKEGYMAFMGIKLLKKDKMLDGAMWQGKVCTATLFLGMMILFLIPGLSHTTVNTIITVMMIVMVITLILYIPVFRRMENDERSE